MSTSPLAHVRKVCCSQLLSHRTLVHTLARAQSEGSSFSLSALERRIGVVFFYWDVFNVFLQVGWVCVWGGCSGRQLLPLAA